MTISKYLVIKMFRKIFKILPGSQTSPDFKFIISLHLALDVSLNIRYSGTL